MKPVKMCLPTSENRGQQITARCRRRQPLNPRLERVRILATKVFIRSILVGTSFILCSMSVLSVGATSQGEGTPSISERDGIIEKPAFYLRQQKGLLSESRSP